MPKAEWGTKRVCPTTGKRFYDLNKTPIVSPYTGEIVTLESGNRTRVAVAEKAAKVAVRETDDLVEDDAVIDDDDSDIDIDDDILEDEDGDDDVSLDDIAAVASDDDEV